MSSQSTTWELKLKESVMAPLKKLMDIAGGTQKKIDNITGGLNKLTKASNVMGRDFKRNLEGLNNTLQGLEKRQAQAFSTKHIQAYQRMIDKTRLEINRLNDAMVPKKNWKQRFSAAMDESPMLSNIKNMATNPAMLAGVGILAVTAGMAKSIDIAKDFDYGIAKINATAQLGEESLGKLKGRIKEIGSASGGNFELMPGAYEKILSQTGKVNLSLDILETSVAGAKAGFTDIDTVASALAQTLSAVGEGNATANEVLDTFMKGKALGAGEFSDFANYMPQLIAAGKNISIGFKDTTALFSYMTAKGNSAADSAMLIQNAFTALQKNEVMKGLGKKGIPLFNVDGSRRDIKTIFLELSKKLGGLTDKSKSQFLIDIGLNDAQARNAFSILTSDATKFEEIMTGVNNSMGETNRQLEKTNNLSRSWGDIWDEIKSIGESIGSVLLPVIDALVQGIAGFGRDLKGLFNGDLFKGAYKDEYNAMNAEVRTNTARKFADEQFQKKYGFSASDKSRTFSSEQVDFYGNTSKWMNEQLKGINASSKNQIVDEKGKPTKKATDYLKDTNTGKAIGDSGSKASNSGGSATGDGAKIRNLTMNLTITNMIKSDEVETQLAQKITDEIVDAARDGMVTIGV